MSQQQVASQKLAVDPGIGETRFSAGVGAALKEFDLVEGGQRSTMVGCHMSVGTD